ncbi:MAG: AAA family ATPase [Acidobacteriota bacterium]
MRLLRLKLRHFRGVEEREVSFLPRGVTIVEGPNESGKTSLAEGLDLLLEKRASSTDRLVRAVQPVGRDVGSEVELEAEAGPYRFVFAKRYHRQHETRLQVTAPRAESLAGRAAHDRLRELLAETVDLDLWRALRVDQGQSLLAPEVGRSRSLLSALEGEGASHAEGARDEALFSLIGKELEHYFSPKARRPSGELRQARLAAEEALRERATVDAECARLEEDVERSELLERRRQALRDEVEVAGERQREAAARHAEVARLAEEVASRKALLDDERAKGQLLRELAEAEIGERDLQRRRDDARRALGRAEIDVEPARRAQAAAESEAQAAVEALAAARQVVATGRRRRELEERWSVAAGREEQLEQLAAQLAAIGEDFDLAALEELERQADRTEAALDAASARLTLRAERTITLAEGESEHTVAAGESYEGRVDRTVRLRLTDGELEIRPGRDPRALGERLDALRRDLAERLRQLGCDSLDEARRQRRRRQELGTQIESLRSARVPGESPAELQAALQALPAEVGGDVDIDRLAAVEAATRAALAESRRTLAAAQGELDRAQRLDRDLEIEGRAAENRRSRARERIGSLVEALSGPAEEEEGQLGLFHQAIDRSDIERAVAAARRREERAEERWQSSTSDLAAARPEEVARRLETAERELARRRRDLDEVVGELRELQGRLAARRQQDLFERQADAASLERATQAALAAVEARAAAVTRLYDGFVAARDRARETYSEPLRQRIEELGRELFGADFAVELDDELQIERRVLAGQILAVDQLSAGTREQLGLIARLAAALVAAPTAGVPVIIDDALGFSDPQRLRAMGRVLELAGERCQVILLTCFPERYRSVRGARFVHLEGARGPDSATS